MHNTSRRILNAADRECGELKFARSWMGVSASPALTWWALNQDERQRLASVVIHTFLQMGSCNLQMN